MLHQQYRIQEKIGDALYGSVWLCEDARQKNELVAVKQVSLSVARRALAVNCHMDNPWDERRVTSNLMQLGCHDHILQCKREFIENGSWFMVMEYCDGGDLLELLQSAPDTRFPERLALHCFRQVVDGVQFLHANGIAHRDLSLENVLVRDGVAKICDFGVSTQVNRVCTEKVGKAYYMAPEVVAEQAYDPAAADMWSLGIMLFIMITGSPLTPRASVQEQAFRALQTFGVEKIFEAWGMTASVSPQTIDLLTGLLQVSPAKRYTIDDVLFHAGMQRA
ncbi:Serine/threonine protein kinase, partial [Globisporangium splendens]